MENKSVFFNVRHFSEKNRVILFGYNIRGKKICNTEFLASQAYSYEEAKAFFGDCDLYQLDTEGGYNDISDTIFCWVSSSKVFCVRATVDAKVIS